MRTLLMLVFVGCGGAVSGPIGNDDGGADASMQMKDSAAMDVQPMLDVSTVDCKALEAKINARREELKVCCPFCGMQQCTHVTQDVCCPFSTTATETSDFDKMVAEYKQYCKPICPGAPCAPTPSSTCKPTSNNQGICL